MIGQFQVDGRIRAAEMWVSLGIDHYFPPTLLTWSRYKETCVCRGRESGERNERGEREGERGRKLY